MRAKESAAIIDDIYAGIRFPQRWPDIVRRVGDWLDADIGMMLSPSLPGVSPMPLVAYGLDMSPIVEKFPTHIGRAEFTKRALATGRVPGAFLLDELMSSREQSTDAFWQDVVAPLGVTSGIFSMIRTPEDNGRPILLNYYRRTPKPKYMATDISDLEELLPHLRRSLGVILDAPPAATPAAEITSAYDAIGAACFLCGLDGAITYRNAAADALVQSGDGIDLFGGRLSLWDQAAQLELDAALKRVCGEAWSSKYRTGAEVLARRPSGGVPLVIVATPMADENPISAWAAPARCVLFIIEETLREDARLPDRLQRLYGLTKAEAEIAIGVASGDTVQELATARQTKVATIRTQLKAVLFKTGARKQSELAAIVNRLRI